MFISYESYVGLPMFKSILMNSEVFPIYISSPLNFILITILEKLVESVFSSWKREILLM